jgi:elongator complex protein 5
MVSDQVSSIFWLSHSDLHEERVTAVLGYISSMVASVEPFNQSANGQRCNRENLSLLERNYCKGKFHARFKRRNGRVRVMVTSISLSLWELLYLFLKCELT